MFVGNTLTIWIKLTGAVTHTHQKWCHNSRLYISLLYLQAFQWVWRLCYSIIKVNITVNTELICPLDKPLNRCYLQLQEILTYFYDCKHNHVRLREKKNLRLRKLFLFFLSLYSHWSRITKQKISSGSDKHTHSDTYRERECCELLLKLHFFPKILRKQCLQYHCIYKSW